MSAIQSSRRTDEEVTDGRRQVALPIVGAARTDLTQTEVRLEDGDWFLGCIKRAQENVMQQKVAVSKMGMAKTQYIENLQGTGHLSARRLGLLGDSFFFALIDELRIHFHINTDEERLARALSIRAEADKVITEIATKGVRR